MTVLATVAALQAKHAAITGITSAPIAMPAALNTSDLPTVLVFPGEAEWRMQAEGLYRQEREYIVQVFVWPVAQGQGIDEGYQAVLPFFERFALAYLADPTLGGVVDHIWRSGNNIKDSGHAQLTFAGIAYHGIVFRLRITEKTT